MRPVAGRLARLLASGGAGGAQSGGAACAAWRAGAAAAPQQQLSCWPTPPSTCVAGAASSWAQAPARGHEQWRGFAVLPTPAAGSPPPPQQQRRQQQQPGAAPPAAAAPGALSRQPPRHVVYRGKWIKVVRFAVRGKVAQLMGAAGVACGLAGLSAADLSLVDAAVLGGIIMGSVGGSLSLWYYGRRYVGELSLLEPARDTLRFSVLDLWGNREDVDVPVAAVTPPFRNVPAKLANHIANQLLFPVNVDVPGGKRRQFYVSVVAGNLVDGPSFMQLLKGEYVPPAQQAGSGGDGGGSS